MLAYYYDKTFDGLLTAVFDAYSRKTFPDKLVGEGGIEPLFTDERYTVITQQDRANRVWVALQKIQSALACNMLTYVWLSEVEGYDDLLFRYICKTFNSKQLIETNFGDPDVLAVHQLAKKVNGEKHSLKQFVRFQKAADEIYFAPVAPRYNSLPLAVNHFADRFSDQRWVIYDVRRHYGFYYDLKNVAEITLDDDSQLLGGKLDEKLMAEDEKLFQELWKGYFNAMTIKERINLKLHRQHMPKRFWKFLTEKQ